MTKSSVCIAMAPDSAKGRAARLGAPALNSVLRKDGGASAMETAGGRISWTPGHTLGFMLTLDERRLRKMKVFSPDSTQDLVMGYS